MRPRPRASRARSPARSRPSSKTSSLLRHPPSATTVPRPRPRRRQRNAPTQPRFPPPRPRLALACFPTSRTPPFLPPARKRGPAVRAMCDEQARARRSWPLSVCGSCSRRGHFVSPGRGQLRLLAPRPFLALPRPSRRSPPTQPLPRCKAPLARRLRRPQPPRRNRPRSHRLLPRVQRGRHLSHVGIATVPAPRRSGTRMGVVPGAPRRLDT
jgi:hypothetical protein